MCFKLVIMRVDHRQYLFSARKVSLTQMYSPKRYCNGQQPTQRRFKIRWRKIKTLTKFWFNSCRPTFVLSCKSDSVIDVRCASIINVCSYTEKSRQQRYCQHSHRCCRPDSSTAWILYRMASLNSVLMIHK